jgi:hypothetical protein
MLDVTCQIRHYEDFSERKMEILSGRLYTILRSNQEQLQIKIGIESEALYEV